MGDVLVGRREEVAAIDSLLGDVASLPGMLVLDGEAGIGKTRIWEEGVERARGLGFAVLSARPAETEVQLSFAVLGDLVGDLAGDGLPRLPPLQRRALEAALRLSRAPARAPDQYALRLAVLTTIRAVACDRPTLVAVDDVQWLDAPTGRVLEFVLHRLQTETIAILATFRGSSDEPLPFGLDRVAPTGRLARIQLGPLSVGALHELLRLRLDHTFARPLLLKLHGAAGGNPQFALELARFLLQQGVDVSPDDPLPVPRTLQEVVRRRLRLLSPRTRRLLVAAATLSHPTAAAIVRAVGRDAGDADLDDAVRAGIVAVQDGEIRFTHPLFASVLYAETPPAARRALHRRLAEAVDDAEERARHLAAASDMPDASVAAVLDEAAVSARARGAPEAAAELADRSIRLTPSDDPSSLHDRRLCAADHHYAAGDVTRARSLLEEALEAAPVGPGRAHALFRLAGGHEGHFDKRLNLLDEALEHAGEDMTLRADIHRTRGLLIQTTDVPGSEPDVRAAMELAQRVGDKSLIARCLAASARVDFLLGRPVDNAAIKRLTELATADDPSPEWQWDSVIFGLLFTAISEHSALEELERACERARKAGDHTLLLPLCLLSGALEMFGDLARAKECAREACDFALQAGLDAAEPMCLAVLAFVEVGLGEAEAARQHLEACRAAAQRVARPDWDISARIGLGILALHLGNYRAAVDWLGSAYEDQGARGVRDFGALWFVSDLVEALVETGDTKTASDVTAAMEQMAASRVLDREWAVMLARRSRALVDASQGRVDEAIASLEAVLDERKGYPEGRQYAYTLLLLGRTARRARRKRFAREALEAALELFERFGARLGAERARSELARIGGRTGSANGLSETERRIADLVVAGRSNKEVAETLNLSPKTVAWNLTKIYEKLGVRSRTELAARRLAH